MAYQGYGRGIRLDFIRLLDQEVIQKRIPDLTIYIDIEPLIGLTRARGRNQHSRHDEGRFENESVEFFTKVREGYLKLAKDNPLRIKTIDGNHPEAGTATLFAIS
jgi:dTMP kinase